MTEDDEEAELFVDTLKEISGLMHGKPHRMQLAICAELSAMWIVGHEPAGRPLALRVLVEKIADAVPHITDIWANGGPHD